MATVVGVFSRRDQAERAVRALKEKGFDENEISIAAKDDRSQSGGREREDDRESGRAGGFSFEAGEDELVGMEEAGDGAAWGGTIGGVAGLLAGAGALAIPGIGPIVAAGPLAAALSGAVAGGVVGGLLDLGIPTEEGKRYEQDVKEGKSLAIIRADRDKAQQAESVLRECGAEEVRGYDSQEGQGKH